jgi:predicted nuclease with TOPRIM domain
MSKALHALDKIWRIRERMNMPSASTQQEIEQLRRRLEILEEEAESELRQRLKEARAAVTDLEFQLSEITGRPSGSQVRAADSKRWPPITDEQLEVQILFVLQKEGENGLNAKTIAERLSQNPVRIRTWIKEHPKAVKREGAGPGTKFFPR